MKNIILYTVASLFILCSIDILGKINIDADSSIVKEEKYNIGLFSGIRFGETSPVVDAGWTASAHIEIPTGKGWGIKVQPTVWVAKGYEDYSSYKERYFQSGKLNAYSVLIKAFYKVDVEDVNIQLSLGPGLSSIYSDRGGSFSRSYGILEFSGAIVSGVFSNLDLYIECKKQYIASFYGQSYDPWLLGLGFNYKFLK